MSLTDTPRLRRGVRVGTDPLSDETILLFPEGVLFLNETAAAVIQRCDGSRSIADVVQALSDEYNDVVAEDVMSLLRDLIAQRLLVAGRG
ncbi:MAG: pyrroloquinoline quinone biosynthesis peptide chaperone PqqD [Pseudonocardiaceae bacterium]